MNPRTTFAVAGFQERRRVSGTPEGIALENKGKTLLKPSSAGKPGPVPTGENEPNRDTTSQIETSHRTSQRQVATCLSRIDSKWRSVALIPFLPYSRVGFDHHGLRGLLDAVRAPVGGDGAGIRLQRTGKVTSGPGCPRGATGRLCCRWRESTSSRGSHRQGGPPRRAASGM